MQECKHQANKRAVIFCPFCGLVADNTQKGTWVQCYHCDSQFLVFVKAPAIQTWGEGKIEVSCKRKVRYHSLEEARQAYLEIADRERHTHSEMRIYLCDICGMFHLGHEPQKGFKSRTWAVEEADIESTISAERELAATRAGKKG